MTLRKRIVELEEDNAALRAHLASRRKLDGEWKGSLADAVNAVAHNIKMLTEDQQLRVLLAVAVLYGHIKPGPPKPPKRSTDSISPSGGRDG